MMLFRNFLRNPTYLFSTVKKEPAPYIDTRPPVQILNDNLLFNAHNYHLYLVPRHPATYIKNGYPLTVANTHPVMEFLFKIKKELDVPRIIIQKNFPYKLIEQVSIKFKFEDLARLIDMETGKGKKQVFRYGYIHNNVSINQRYCFSDTNKDNLIKISVINGQKEASDKSRTPENEYSRLDTWIDYDDFQLIKQIIKASLFDLSGLRLNFDLRRFDEIERMSKIIKNQKKYLNESRQFYKER